jgi:hypothetical protein
MGSMPRKIPAVPGKWFWTPAPIAIVVMIVLALLGVELRLVGAAIITVLVVGWGSAFGLPFVLQPRKNARVRAWAERHGWEYRAFAPRERLRGFGIFTQGFTSDAVNLVSGTHRGHRVKAFSFRTTTGGGRTSDMHRYEVVTVALGTRVPMIQLHPLSWWRRALHRGGARSDLRTGHPAFDSRFRVETRDVEFARAVLGGSMAEWLASDPRASAHPLRFSDDELITWRAGTLVPDRALASAELLIDLVERLPGEVLARER